MISAQMHQGSFTITLTRQWGYFYSWTEPAAGAEEESKVMQRESHITFLRCAIKTLTVLEMTWLSVMESGSVYFLSQIYVSILPHIIVHHHLQCNYCCKTSLWHLWQMCCWNRACRFLYEHWLNCVSLVLSLSLVYRPFLCFQCKWHFEGFEQSP